MRLLRNEDEWRTLASRHRDGDRLAAPVSYPCLGDVLSAAETCYACYVYPADAKRLCLASEPLVEERPVAVERTVTERAPFERHVSALLLTLVAELESVGITKRDRFEQEFAKRLALVDQVYDASLDSQTCEDFASGKLRRDVYRTDPPV